MKKILFLILFAINYSLSAAPIFADNSFLKIHFIDAGEGEAIFIEQAEGENALIDTGNLITGVKVLNYLEDNKVKKLNHLILTHPHLDHIGGVFYIAQNILVEKIYDNGQDISQLVSQQDSYCWYQQLVRSKTNYRVLAYPGKIFLGGLALEILWPKAPLVYSDFNDNSLVIMVKYKDFRCLLMADATNKVEKNLLENVENLNAKTLKVGHHGSEDSNSSEFLEAVSPAVSVISVNKGNIRGYPSESTLTRLKKTKTAIYRTDQDGNICLSVDEGGKIFRIEKEK